MAEAQLHYCRARYPGKGLLLHSELYLKDEGLSVDYLTVAPDVMTFVDTAAHPVSTEFEYLHNCVLKPVPPKHPDPRCTFDGYWVLDKKAPRDKDKLRQQIAANGLPRTANKHEKNPPRRRDPKSFDSNVKDEYSHLLFYQRSNVRWPLNAWRPIDNKTCCDESNGRIFYRGKNTEPILRRFLPTSVRVELMNSTVTNLATQRQPVKPNQIAATVENPAFKRVYEEAVKNLEPESAVTSPRIETKRLPLTSFAAKPETEIEKAIRQAKEKKRDKPKKSSGPISAQRHLPTKTTAKPLQNLVSTKKSTNDWKTADEPKNGLCKAVKNLEAESVVTSPRFEIECRPITSFAAKPETEVEKAIRIAKEKKREKSKKTFGAIGSPKRLATATAYSAQNGVSTNENFKDGKRMNEPKNGKKYTDEPFISPITTPFITWEASFDVTNLPPIKFSKNNRGNSSLCFDLPGAGASNPGVKSKPKVYEPIQVLPTNVPETVACNLSDDEDDILMPVPLSVPSIAPPGPPNVTSDASLPNDDEDDFDILRIHPDDDMDWLLK